MRALLQRVTEAAVAVEGAEVARIGRGLLLLVGVEGSDTEAKAAALAEKVAHLRVFPSAGSGQAPEGSHFDRSLLDVGGEVLVVSQFTLHADTRHGRRPSFEATAPAAQAAPLVEAFTAHLRSLGLPVQTGRFGAMMQVSLCNDGPVTLMLEA